MTYDLQASYDVKHFHCRIKFPSANHTEALSRCLSAEVRRLKMDVWLWQLLAAHAFTKIDSRNMCCFPCICTHDVGWWMYCFLCPVQVQFCVSCPFINSGGKVWFPFRHGLLDRLRLCTGCSLQFRAQWVMLERKRWWHLCSQVMMCSGNASGRC